MGSPPGYVGYGEGGVLTEAVRRRPYSRGPARRDGEGASRRAGRLLPGVRQGQHEGRRRPRHRLQEHRHHHDVERRHRPDHQAVRRSRDGARCRGTGRGAAAGADEVLQAGLSRPRDAGAVFSAVATTSSARSSAAARPHPRGACARATARRSTGTPELVDTIAARCTESIVRARATSRTSCRAPCCPNCRPTCWRAWPTVKRSAAFTPASNRMGCYSLPLTNRKVVVSSTTRDQGGRLWQYM